MIETMEKSSGNVLGYKVSGEMTRTDYATLDPAVGAAIEKHGSVCLLFDMKDLHWEKLSAWASDLDFGKTYKDKIDKMALVGNAEWEKYLAKAAQPFYAKQIKFFRSDDDAWDWLNS